ncbi:MAG TPA: SUMF1/EgtB/PvdO family nonheme iron enzyme [Acidobacteriota bacterium]|nr:SUMF1/EgtB/PvdO family nonheme iron enzyme [Acidobacteriota bacterium]
MAEYYTSYPRTILWLVPGGEARVGGQEDDTQPSFTVEVDPFYISKWPITNEQYRAYDPDYRPLPHSDGDRDPAVGLSYRDALGYAGWYARISKKPMRLPSEIEWEYACRAGRSGRWFFDPEEADEYLWDARNSRGRVQPVEHTKANEFGLHATLGSVWEWTASLYRPYPLEKRLDDPEAPGKRVLRGGSYVMDREQISCSLRKAADPRERLADAGFRLVRSFGRLAGG